MTKKHSRLYNRRVLLRFNRSHFVAPASICVALLALAHCSLAGLDDGSGGSDAGPSADGSTLNDSRPPADAPPPEIPTLHVSDQGPIAALAATNAFVAWQSGDDEMHACRTSDCTSSTTVDNEQRTIVGRVGFVGDTFYYLRADQPVRCELPSSGTLRCVDNNGIGFDFEPKPVNSAVDLNGMFVSCEDGAKGTKGIYACDAVSGNGCGAWTANGTGSTSWRKIQSGTAANAIALSGSEVFWAAPGTNGAIYRCPRAGCGGAPTALAMNQLDPKSIAVNGSTVYWATSDGAIRSCTDDCAGGPKTLATGQSGARNIVFSSSMIYWANENAGTIMRCDPAACSPVTLAEKIDRPQQIAANDSRIYFSVNAGAIYSLTK